jgi:aminoacylase
MDSQGRIYARGAQDMKCVGMQYLGAIRALKKDGVRPKRTIHLTFVPDEEIGGQSGMMDFVQTEEFKNLNCAFTMDEGMASEGDVYQLFYGERTVWRMLELLKF